MLISCNMRSMVAKSGVMMTSVRRFLALLSELVLGYRGSYWLRPAAVMFCGLMFLFEVMRRTMDVARMTLRSQLSFMVAPDL